MRSTAGSNGVAIDAARRRLTRAALVVVLALGAASPALAQPAGARTAEQQAAQPRAESPASQSAEGRLAHALAIGIDDYAALPKLRGAVADAADIAQTARALGAEDVVLLTDAQADRVSILRAAEAMRARTKKGELVLLSIAGHGALEPERTRGSSPDGLSAAFLLGGFAPSGPATTQRILDAEFMRLIRDFEDKGARVLFVADSCSGGGLARGVDARGGELVYRAAPRYRISADELKPISTDRDAAATELSFKRSLFLAAVERDQKSPEVRAPGGDAWRGALSYALARGIEGAADADLDGRVSVKELFDYVRHVSYQITDQRQEVVTRAAPIGDPARETVVSLSRGVSILNPKAPTGEAASALPPDALPPSAGPPAPASPAPTASAGDLSHGPRIRLASLDGRSQRLAALTPMEEGFDVVAPNQQPDLVWDPVTRDAIAAGDVIARNLDVSALPAVVDRIAAARGIKTLMTRSPLPMRLAPDSRLHKRGEKVKISVDEVGGKAFYVFNMAGDGTVQLLYPVGSDPQIFGQPNFQMEFAVREPFGADQVIAVAAPQRLGDLDQALKRLNGRRSSALALKALVQALQPGARVGSVTLVTEP
jgi:DNA-binding MurR/RpiR family transcriptional regulator